MLKIDSTFATLCIAGAVAIGISMLANSGGSHDVGSNVSGIAGTQALAEGPTTSAPWAASATGRIEPKGGKISISAEVGGRVVDVPVDVNDVVSKGEILVRIDDEDYISRVAAARVEEDVRMRERDEEPVKGLAQERRDAEDAAAAAERKLFDAREAFDAAVAAKRAGKGDDKKVADARKAWDEAEADLAKKRQDVAKVQVKKDMPLPIRGESSLQIARSERHLAEAALERTRIRAPRDGTVLSLEAKVGEVVAPSPQAPIVTFGNLSGLRVRAEVEERDVAKVRVGQKVVVRADAFSDREFEGVVTQVASALGAPNIATRGPRRPNDVDVLEVLADLDGTPPLLTGMRVDVFFKRDDAAQSAVPEKAQ